MVNTKNQKTQNKIYFVVPNRHWGTYFLRGVQVSKALKKAGISTQVIAPKSLLKVKNGIVVIVKHITGEICLSAKENNNTVIYDLLDGYEQDLGQIFAEGVIDGIILSTDASKSILSLPKALPHTTIYHHIDPRLEKIVDNSKQAAVLNMCYIGNLPEHTNNVSFTDRIDTLAVIETNTRKARNNNWMKQVSPYNCHYAVRTDTLQKKAKPLIKVGVAAVCRANMIINRSNAAAELLGEEYPFYTGDDFDSVMNALIYAQEVFGQKEWNRGLERMTYLKDRLSLPKIIHDYIDFFKQWTRR